VLFTDSAFLLRFLPLLLALFFLGVAMTPRSWRSGARRFSLANTVLLGGSLLFLVNGAGAFARVIAAAVVCNYVAGAAIGWARRAGASVARPSPLPEALLTLAVTGNVVLLGVYKYAMPLSGGLAARSFAVPQLLAPFGLTFIACHAISYLVDVYRGETPHQVSPIRASLYLIFFPMLCAGPLVRYSEMGPQLAQRRVTMAAFAYGVRRWLVGLSKVVFLADVLAVPADAVFAMPVGELGLLQAWLGAVCFALQVYFALSGYADMAIGFGRMFGFRLSENFRWPYGAATLTEFWRRWNISLMDWCRGYLGLSLGATTVDRVGHARRLVTLFLCVGLWYGPGLNVMVWGMLHGMVVALEHVGLGTRLARLPNALRHAYLLLVVLCLWVVFRAESPAKAIVMLQTMTGFAGAAMPSPLVLAPTHWVALAAAVVTAVPIWPGFGRWLVTIDALTTSTLILVSTSCVFVWRRFVGAARFLVGRQR
jgi:alginate O-acetyltransferase complex protein AlgI|tara:strand:- start:124 stop:1566 length:1443 start_codon:yes stop_codon:yes gene_type:complete